MGKLLEIQRVKIWIRDDVREGSGGLYRISNVAFKVMTPEGYKVWLTEFFDGEQRDFLLNHNGYESIEDIRLRARDNLCLAFEDIEVIKVFE